MIELREIRQKNSLENDKLVKEKLELVNNLKEEGNLLKELELERIKLIDINENLNLEIINLNGKIRNREESINYHQNQLDELNKLIGGLNNQINELDFNNKKLIEELNNFDSIN